MIEIAVGIAFFVVCLKAARSLFGTAVKEVHSTGQEARDKWKDADAFERERMVRKATGWRVIGRVAGAGALTVGAVMFAPLPLIAISVMAACRILRPIPKEMRYACAYRSTGAKDEPRYSSGDVDAL